MLVDSERGSLSAALDKSCLSLLTGRGEDGRLSICDECGRDVAYEEPEFILQAHATLAASCSGSNADVRFKLKTRHTYTACPDCIRAQHITDGPAAAPASAAAAPSPVTTSAPAGPHAAAATAAAAAAGFGAQTKQQLALLAAAAAAGVVVKQEVPVAGARLAGGRDATAAVRPPLSPDAPLAGSTAAAQVPAQQQQQQQQQAQQPGSANAVGSAAGAAVGGAASPQKPAVVVRGEVVCPVHTQAVFRYSVSETTDDFRKTYLLHCPDCGSCSQELPTLQELCQHVQRHLSTAQHGSHPRLSKAWAAGAFACSTTLGTRNAPNGSHQNAAGAGADTDAGLGPSNEEQQQQQQQQQHQGISATDNAVWQLLARLAALVAVHIVTTTRAAAGVPLYARHWKPAKAAAAAAAAAADGAGVSVSAQQQQQQQQSQALLPWRQWAVSRLSSGCVLQQHANWARPSSERLNAAAACDRPPASLLDLVLAPPYVGVEGYAAGGALSKLAVLIARKRRELRFGQVDAWGRSNWGSGGHPPGIGKNNRGRPFTYRFKTDPQSLSPLSPQQQQQQQQQGVSTQKIKIEDAAAAAAGGGGCGEASSGCGASLSAADVLSLMLADDPVFGSLPEPDRIPAFLQQAQVGSLADVEFAEQSSVFLSTYHMAMCSRCSRTSGMLVHGGLSGVLRKCRYCCAAMCQPCCESLSEPDAEGGSKPQQQQQQADSKAAEAGSGTAAAGMDAAAAGEGDVAVAPSEVWGFGLCPWCSDHPDTQHIWGAEQQQQQQRQQPSAVEPAAAASGGSSKGRGVKRPQAASPANQMSKQSPVKRCKARSGAAGAGVPGASADLDSAGASPAAAAAAAAAGGSKQAAKAAAAAGGAGSSHAKGPGASPPAAAAPAAAAAAVADELHALGGRRLHSGCLTPAELQAYASELSMTAAQEDFFRNFRSKRPRSGCSSTKWCLLPASAAVLGKLPPGFVGYQTVRPLTAEQASRVETFFVAPDGTSHRSVTAAQRHMQAQQQDPQPPAAAAAAPTDASTETAAAAAAGAAGSGQLTPSQGLAQGLGTAAAVWGSGCASDSDSLGDQPSLSTVQINTACQPPQPPLLQQQQQGASVQEPQQLMPAAKRQRSGSILPLGTADAAAAADTGLGHADTAQQQQQQPVAVKLEPDQQHQHQPGAEPAAGPLGLQDAAFLDLPALPAVLDPTQAVTLSLALLRLYRTLCSSQGDDGSSADGQQQQQQQRVVQLEQLCAVSRALAQGPGDLQVAGSSSSSWWDEFELGYGFVQEAAALGDMDATREAFCALLSSSGAADTSTQQQQQQQQQGELPVPFPLAEGFSLPESPDPPQPIPGLAVSLALQRLHRGLGAALGGIEQRALLLKQLMAVSRALKQQQQQGCDGAASAGEVSWRASFVLGYRLLQEWVQLREVDRVSGAFAALLADSSRGLLGVD